MSFAVPLSGEAKDVKSATTKGKQSACQPLAVRHNAAAAALRAAAQTHFVAKSTTLGTPLRGRVFLDCVPLLLSFKRNPLRWASV